MATMSGSFSRSWLQHGGDDLDLVAEALREQRADRPVDQARDQGLVLGGPALALEEAAGDLARGEGLLLVVHGQREEVLARPHRTRRRPRCRARWCRRAAPSRRHRPGGRPCRSPASGAGRPRRCPCDSSCRTCVVPSRDRMQRPFRPRPRTHRGRGLASGREAARMSAGRRSGMVATRWVVRFRPRPGRAPRMGAGPGASGCMDSGQSVRLRRWRPPPSAGAPCGRKRRRRPGGARLVLSARRMRGGGPAVPDHRSAHRLRAKHMARARRITSVRRPRIARRPPVGRWLARDRVDPSRESPADL